MEVYYEQINRCSGHDYVTIITGESLVKPGDLKRGATPLGTVPSAETAQWEAERSVRLAVALL